jgi:hypothetical protein
VSSAFFGLFSILDDSFILDAGIRQIYEDVALAVILAIIGITGAKYFSDASTDAVLIEVKKMQLEFNQRLENLESRFKLDSKS